MVMLLFRSVVVVVVVVAEERGEHGELARAPLLVLVGYVAFLQRAASAAAVGGPDLRRPEEEQARVVPERARRVRLPARHVRRHRPRERQGLGGRNRRGLRVRGRRRRCVAVLRGLEREQAVAEARGAHAAAGLVRVLLAPHAHHPVAPRLISSPLLSSPLLSSPRVTSSPVAFPRRGRWVGVGGRIHDEAVAGAGAERSEICDGGDAPAFLAFGQKIPVSGLGLGLLKFGWVLFNPDWLAGSLRGSCCRCACVWTGGS